MDGTSFFFFFFLFIHYSCATLLDHDEGYVQSVSQPQTAHGGAVQASRCPPPRPVPKKVDVDQRKDKGNRRLSLLSRRCHEGWDGQEQRFPPWAQRLRLRPPLVFLFLVFLELTLRRLTPLHILSVFCRQDYFPYVRCHEEPQHRLAAPRFGKKLVSLPPEPPSSRLLPDLHP